MRIVVFSDSHKNYAALEKVVLARPDAQLFLHLGDGEREFEELQLRFPDILMYGIQGNCDYGSLSETSNLLTLGGKRVFFTHGHLFRVKLGLEELLHNARNVGANVVLFGHTHRTLTLYEDGLYILNPGSVSTPQEGPASYGIVDITSAGIVTSIVPVDGGRGR